MTSFKHFNMLERMRCLHLCISMVELGEQPITSVHQAAGNRAAIRSMRASIKRSVRRLQKTKGTTAQFEVKVDATMSQSFRALMVLGEYIRAHSFEVDDRWWLP